MPRRPPKPPNSPTPLTLAQVRQRLESLEEKLTALGSANHLTNGQLRHRALLIRNALERLLDRFPPGDSAPRRLWRHRTTCAFPKSLQLRHLRSRVVRRGQCWPPPVIAPAATQQPNPTTARN